MKKELETLQFIESDTMREFLTKELEQGRLSLSEKEMCSLVWNSNYAFSMKQAFLMEFPELPCAIDLVKRLEAVRRYLQENHAYEVYVLLINDQFYGVYNRYDTARTNFREFADTVSEASVIYLEMYDIRGSIFRGRIRLDISFEPAAFDFSQDIIKKEKLWENAETDAVTRLYIRLPHPFQPGDIVTRKGSLDTYKLIDTTLKDDLFGELNAADMRLVGILYDEDDPEPDYQEALEEEPEELPLLELEFLD